MMKVSESLSSFIARLLLLFRDSRNTDLKAAYNNSLAAGSSGFDPLRCSPSSNSSRSTSATKRNSRGSVKLSSKAPLALIAMAALLIVTGCGGGWSIGGQPPVITGQPANQTVNVGQTTTFTVTATGTGPLTYQWSVNGTAIGGATSSSYTTPGAASTDSGSVFTVTVTNSSGTVTSTPATLTVAAGSTTVNPNAPLIITQPANQTVQVGQTATFSVTATGAAPFTYQWYKAGVAIAGASSSTYTTPATATADSGSLFTVTVTDAEGTATSGPATLTVITPAPGLPTITNQPASQTVTAGQIATFNVTATGIGPLIYQWYKGGAAVAGATSSTYTTPPTANADSGSLFTVTVTNAAGTVTSTPATLTVITAPIIVTPPANQTVSAGQTASFTVVATGTAPITYQWFKNGTAIGGATSSSYTTPTTVAGDSGSLFTVTATNTAGTATSTPATLTVTTAPVITSQPVNQTVNAGQTATFNVAAAGTGPLTYQWFKGGVAIGGATSSAYTTPAAVVGDSGSIFTVTVTNTAGSVTSAPASLTVNTPPVITNQPANQTVNPGQTATFSVTATGSAPLTYQWFKGGAAIGGATSSSYTTPVTALTDSGSVFTVTVTNPAGTATSSPASLTVNTAPTITTPPASQTVNAGQTAAFTVVASGVGTLTYQWYVDRRSYFQLLHYPSDCYRRQRFAFHRDCHQCSRYSNQRTRYLNHQYGSHNHNSTSQRDSQCGTNRDLHRDRSRYRAVNVSMVEKRVRNFRSNVQFLHDPGNRQWR
jgi:hypothetical protein